jgi:hypothetical protein
MLAGEDQAWRQSMRCERVSDGRQLYGFGPGTNDQPYVGKTQPSP